MKSNLDGHNYTAPPRQEEAPKPSPVKAKYPTQSAKLGNLSSQIALGGTDANIHFHAEQNKGEIVDFVLSGLKPSTDEYELKKIAKVKHIISSELDVDNLRGTCKGTGRMKIRLNKGEDREAIRQNFTRLGVIV